jgi:acyl-CoA synthetase (AMP-forming)/AMP-acid ligase II
VASRDTDGYITYIGRTNDVFKASDYKISPFELESVLIEQPARRRRWFRLLIRCGCACPKPMWHWRTGGQRMKARQGHLRALTRESEDSGGTA